MTNRILGLGLPGFGGAYTGGTGNAVAILASQYNAAHAWFEPTCSGAVSDGYNGSRDDLVRDYGCHSGDSNTSSNV